MTDPAHLDSDELADLDEGLLDAPTEQSARRHLADCPRCQTQLGRLAQLREQLAADDPGPMPAPVAGAVDAAVTAALAEPTGSAAADAEPPRSGASLTTVPTRPTRKVAQRTVPSWLSAAAAVVVVIGLGALGIKVLGGGSSGSGTSASSAQSAAAAGGAALAAARVVVATGQDYSEATLPGAVPVLLAADARASAAVAAPSGSAPAAAPSGSGVPEALTALDGGPQLSVCVAQLAGAPTTALAVDLASFNGTPAAIVVLPTPDDGSTVDVWVVGAGCGKGNDAQVRYFARVPR